MRKRKIAVVTGSRADYGHLYWVIKSIHDDPSLELLLIVTGMHLSRRFGLTCKTIEKDGFPIARKVRTLLLSDAEESIAGSIGRGVIGFAKVYAQLKPDIILVLGDRFEIFAAASAAVPFRIPIAHIHGGELTEGAFDEQLRHAITKMSHLHFVSTGEHRKRIMHMGESPVRVFAFGAPGIDNIVRSDLLDGETLRGMLHIPGRRKIGIVTYHPVTLEHRTAAGQITELLAALKGADDCFWVMTSSNADTGGRVINKAMEEFAKKNPAKGRFYVSLGRMKYLSLLKNASVMVGNSSSGLIEAPSFGLPVVNIGDRQKGRTRAANVIDIARCRRDLIAKALRRAFSPEFRLSALKLKNPYGSGNASEKIIRKLKSIQINENLLKKRFYETEDSDN